jgi:hypothetical protein
MLKRFIKEKDILAYKRNWMRNWREKNRDPNARKYLKNPFKTLKEYRRNYIKNWRIKNREKSILREHARGIVSRAIKNGILIKENCKVCNSKKSQAHHIDYYRPLDVTWLCQIHHIQEHKKIALLNL